MMDLFTISYGRICKVRAICRNEAAANAFCEANDNTGVLADTFGMVLIVDNVGVQYRSDLPLDSRHVCHLGNTEIDFYVLAHSMGQTYQITYIMPPNAVPHSKRQFQVGSIDGFGVFAADGSGLAFVPQFLKEYTNA